MRSSDSFSVRQFIKFNIVGALNTLVDFVLFFLLSWLGVLPAAAQTVAYTGGLVNSFLLNKSWTFTQHGQSSVKQIIAFIAVNLASLGLSLFLLYLFIAIWEIHIFASKILVTGFTMAVNYIGYKKLVFHGRKPEKTS